MAKVNYTSLKLKTDNSVKTFQFHNVNIDVLQYLPIEDKYDLVMITLQKSFEEEVYNPIKLDMLFHLYLVYMYTNISFTDKQKENESKLYDAIKSNGLLEAVLEQIPEEEYNILFEYISDLADIKEEYNRSVVSLVKKMITDLPTQAQAAMDIVNSFDKEKYQEVIDFAKMANGNRSI
jgi:hypothetical protein